MVQTIPVLVPPRGWWRVIAMTYELGEGGEWIPTVRHEFYGATSNDAHAVMLAHMQTDEFLRECTQRGTFRDSVTCRTETMLEQIK